MAPTAIRERRRKLRYRNLLVRQMVQMKNKISMLLMEAGVSYNKQKLHKAGYFRELVATNFDIIEGLGSLLRVCRETVARLQRTESALVRSLERDSLLMDRVERLMTIPAVGPITALTWGLEVGDVQRFSSIKKAISYCGLCGAEKSSGSTVQRTPFSKQRNKHLQTTLIEAAKIAPRYSSQLAMLLLGPVRHRSAKAQIHLTVIRARAALVSPRTALVNAARGLTKSYGERLRKCGTGQMNREITEGLSPELRDALDPLWREIESLNERIAEYDRRIEQIAKEVYPEVALLKQVKGVGTLIALT